MGIAGIGAVDDLQLEAPVDTGGFRVQRPGRGQQHLVQQGLVGAVGEKLAEIEAVTGNCRIEGDAAFDLRREMDAVDPENPGGGAAGCAGGGAWACVPRAAQMMPRLPARGTKPRGRQGDGSAC